MTLPLHERINLLAKRMTRHSQGELVNVSDLASDLYALAKEVEENGAHATEDVTNRLKGVLNSAVRQGICNYDGAVQVVHRFTGSLKEDPTKLTLDELTAYMPKASAQVVAVEDPFDGSEEDDE